MTFLYAQQAVVPEGLTAADWIRAGGIVLGALVVAVFVRRFADRIARRFEMGEGAARLVARFMAAATFLGGLVYALSSLGVAIGPLLGALGVGGLALAFALQDILENFIAGILLQTRRPFTIGDQVIAGGHEGEVEDVNLRSTVLRTYDGRRVFVPSAEVLKNPIENNTAFAQRRTTLPVGVGYDTDLEGARRVIIEALGSVEGVADEPAPQAFVESFGGSSIDFAVRFWHASRVIDVWRVRHDVAVAIKRAFDEAGIDIPFPIRTLDLPAGVAIEVGSGAGAAGD